MNKKYQKKSFASSEVGRTKLFTFYLILIIFIGVFSCERDEFIDEGIAQENEIEVKSSTINYDNIGTKVVHPYNVNNMKKAWNAISSNVNTSGKAASFAKSTDFDVETSHLYIKFIPRNTDQELLLTKDSTLVFFDYPMDRDFTKAELDARQFVERDSIPKYWASVPVDKVEALPKEIAYVILDSLYLPEADSMFVRAFTGKNAGASSLFAQLMTQAYKQKGITKEYNSNRGSNTYTTRRIEGNIKSFKHTNPTNSTAGSQLPLVGVKVLLRDIFSAPFSPVISITDNNGFYVGYVLFGEGSNSMRVVVRFDRAGNNGYIIREGHTGVAEIWSHGNIWNSTYITPQDEYGIFSNITTSRWDYNIPKNTNQHQWAVIHRATHKYAFEDMEGITRPDRLIIKRFYDASIFFSGYAHTGNIHDINNGHRVIDIETHSNILYHGQNEALLYHLVMHEIAHWSHYRLINNHNDYHHSIRDIDMRRRIYESWGQGVAWYFTKQQYPNFYGGAIDDRYTRLVPDMIDRDAIRYSIVWTPNFTWIRHCESNNFNILGKCGDWVHGYTLDQIEETLRYARSWNSWRDEIIRRYNNPTEIYLYNLFNYDYSNPPANTRFPIEQYRYSDCSTCPPN